MESSGTKNVGQSRTCAVLGLLALAFPAMVYAADYQEPSTGPLASLEFIDDASQKISVHFYGDSKECTDRTNSFVPEKSQRKYVIPAGKELAFTVGMDINGAGPAFVSGVIPTLITGGYRGCTPTVDFSPEAGRTYVFQINTDGKDCLYKLYERPAMEGQKSDQELPIKFAQREWSRAWGNSGPWCKAKK